MTYQRPQDKGTESGEESEKYVVSVLELIS